MCSNPERTLLLTQMADSIGTWLRQNYAHPEIAYWLPRYIKLRGTRPFGNMPGMSADMRRVARSQDLISWKAFMEGKLSKEWFSLQRLSLVCSPSKLTIADWAKRLISQILQVLHAQWIFRNVSLHDAHRGYLRLQKRAAVLEEINRLSQMEPDQVPEGSWYLLGIDFSALNQASNEKQAYWLFAMRAAVRAHQHAQEREARATARTRRAAARQAQLRQARRRSVGTHNVATGELSRSADTTTQISRRRGSASRQRQVVVGAREQYLNILDDFGVPGRSARECPSPSAIEVTRADNKRRRPD